MVKTSVATSELKLGHVLHGRVFSAEILGPIPSTTNIRRPIVIQEQRGAQELAVYFYNDQAVVPRDWCWDDCKAGNRIHIRDPKLHAFMDGQIGFRIESLALATIEKVSDGNAEPFKLGQRIAPEQSEAFRAWYRANTAHMGVTSDAALDEIERNWHDPERWRKQIEKKNAEADAQRKAKGAGAHAAVFDVCIGNRVVIHGLTGRPELNGSFATIVKMPERPGCTRYVLSVDGDETKKLVKRVNFTMVAGLDRKATALKHGDCVVCLEARQATCTAVPCGHLAICDTCAKDMGPRPTCPVCRAQVDRFMAVYVAADADQEKLQAMRQNLAEEKSQKTKAQQRVADLESALARARGFKRNYPRTPSSEPDPKFSKVIEIED